MRRALLSAFAGCVFLVTISGQDPHVKKPKPVDDDVVKISTNLIQVDVTVTDKNGNAIPDLRADEVEIYENGKLQKVSGFSFVRGTRLTEKEAKERREADKKAGVAPPVILPGGRIRPDQVRRTIALVVDDLNLSFASMVWVRHALKKFVEEQVQDGDLVAIIRTGAGVGALQQFTVDRRQLLAAVERVKFNAAGSNNMSFFNPVNLGMTQDVVTAGASGLDPAVPNFSITDDNGIQDRREYETEFNEFRENIFASGTLGALNFLVRGMNELPGRKSVVLLSDGLPLRTRDEAGRPTVSRIFTAMRHLIDFANRSSVVFYAIHAPGLEVPMIGAEEDVSGVARIGGERLTNNIIRSRMNRTNDSQEGLRYIADNTGGLAYINQNDIGKGIRRVLEDQSYYLVAYQPDDDTFNSKRSRFNKFEVKVKRDGAKVRYRSGFFGISEEQISIGKSAESVTDSLIGAITSPFSVNEINVRMNAVFVADAKQTAHVRTFMNIDAEDLTFIKLPDGNHKTSFDIVAVTLSDRGDVLDERPQNLTITIDEAEYQRSLRRGFVTTFLLPIKNPGGYQVRLAVRDTASSRVGSANQYVEVPNLKKDRLTMSGMALENVPFSTWQNARLTTGEVVNGLGDPQWDTAVRQFKPGSVLRFAYHIYNARIDAGRQASLVYRMKLYEGQKLIFETNTKPVPKLSYESPKSVAATGGLKLGESLLPGDYVLQIDIVDGQTRDFRKAATQFIQFEIVP
ncbi:MAG: VWA domain-containing protein [Pyrinomonadaceae bacterium]